MGLFGEMLDTVNGSDQTEEQVTDGMSLKGLSCADPLLTLSFWMNNSAPIHPWYGALLKAQKQWSHAKDKILESSQNKPDTCPRDRKLFSYFMMIIQKLGYIDTLEYLAAF